MAYLKVETSYRRKRLAYRFLATTCILTFSLIFFVSNNVANATIDSGSVSSKSFSNLPSDSYKVRTNAVSVQTQGKTLTGNGVVIGIYDGGINLDNPAFITNGESRIISQACVGESTEINGCETNPAKLASNVCYTTEVGCFHGMAVAGFAAANESIVNINSRSVDVSGIATSAKISYIRQAMSKKGEIRYYDFIRALNKYVEDVREGSPAAPDVINLSLSFPRSSYPNCEVVAVAASGNNSDKARVAYPACMKDVVAVGSSGINDSSGVEEVSDFSNMSSEIDIVAPGENQVGLMPETDRFVSVSGTSFAAPIVTGAVALLKEANPSITTSDVLALLASSSDTVVDPATGQSFPNLNVQKLFGADFDNLASKRQLNNLDSNSPDVDSATDNLFGADQTSGANIEAGTRTLAPSLFSNPTDIYFIGILYFYSAVAFGLSFFILFGYLLGTFIVSRSRKSNQVVLVQGRLSGYYFDHQLIDLTEADDDRESGEDKLLV